MTKEEKDELIALSDLNREDNIKYISSEAQGIAIALDSDKYAPTFCKLERAYICGRRKGFKDGAEFAYNKANEWHFVKDGDLPKEDKKYWILTSSREPKIDSWYGISWVNNDDVIAWKEIVLPKEIE